MKTILPLIILINMLGCSCSYKYNHEQVSNTNLKENVIYSRDSTRLITREKALDIANKCAIQLNYNIQEMGVISNERASILDSLKVNTLQDSDERLINFINRHLDVTFKSRNSRNREILKERYLWVMYYFQMKGSPIGDDLIIFVDANSGEILLTIRGR